MGKNCSVCIVCILIYTVWFVCTVSDFSPNCLVGSAEMILPVCGVWVTGQKEFSLIFEYFILGYEHSNAHLADL